MYTSLLMVLSSGRALDRQTLNSLCLVLVRLLFHLPQALLHLLSAFGVWEMCSLPGSPQPADDVQSASHELDGTMHTCKLSTHHAYVLLLAMLSQCTAGIKQKQHEPRLAGNQKQLQIPVVNLL